MTRRALLLALAVLILAALPARASSPVALYLPITYSTRTDNLGFELVPGYTDNQPLLDELAPVYGRSNFGNQQDPYDSLYQHYLSGGWAEIDEEVLAEFALWKEYNIIPIVIFMYGGACIAPTIAQLTGYGDFIISFVERYHIHHFELWNEPDSATGYASLFGCFGTAYASRLIYLLDYVQARVSSDRYVGVSFAAGNQTRFNMLANTGTHADWVGIHYYAVWGGGIVQYPWPGSLNTLFNMAETSVGKGNVRITEFNLREKEEVCDSAQQAAQRDLILDALGKDYPLVSILVYYPSPDWQCTGIQNTLVEDALLPSYP